MRRLEGKVAIITGAGDGMGRADARLFAREGAKVVATDIKPERVESLAAELQAQGFEAIGLKHDVCNETDWSNVVAKAIEQFGKIDILVNNAGLPGNFTPWDDTSIESVKALFDINVIAHFRGIQSVLAHFKAQGGGAIVNLSSIAGLVALANVHPAYSATKGGNRLLAKSAAIDLAKYGIRVNSVHPGVIGATEQNRELMKAPDSIAPIVNAIPMGRLGDPEEVAKAVLFLASDDASYITGIELAVDGGYTAV